MGFVITGPFHPSHFMASLREFYAINIEIAEDPHQEAFNSPLYKRIKEAKV